jgi:hypothetical protein
MLLRHLVPVAVLPALSLAGAAQARPLTTAPTLRIDIHVTISDKQIVLDRHKAPRGVEAHFIIRNVGREKHTFTLNGLKTPTGKQQGFSETLRPGGRKTVRVFLDFRGRFSYHDGVDRTTAGMSGVFVII